MVFKIRTVNSLPGTRAPGTIYFVSNADNPAYFDMYVVGMQGALRKSLTVTDLEEALSGIELTNATVNTAIGEDPEETRTTLELGTSATLDVGVSDGVASLDAAGKIPIDQIPDGFEGPPGPDGADGADGQSAYEVALSNGFVGDQAAWLASLVGADGADGADGQSAYEVALSNGFVGDQAAWLASLVGADGADGPTGDTGPGFYWLNTYVSGNGYVPGAVVKGSDNNLYIATGSGELGDPATGAGGWNLYLPKGEAGVDGADGDDGTQGEIGFPGFKFDVRRVNANNAQYEVGEIVEYQGSYFICLATNDAITPSGVAIGVYWNPYSFVGPQGEQGIQGESGSQGPQGDPGPAGAEATPITGISNDGTGNITISTSTTSYGPFYLKGDPGANGSDGATGPQGDPGPNQVTTSTSTDITGILKGNGSVVSAATAGTDYVATDDARLSDARTPTAHTHADDTLGPLNKLTFDQTPSATLANPGEVIWNATEETLDLQLHGFVVHTGQHLIYHVQNNTVATIAKGTPVMFAGTTGNSGKLRIKPWDGIGPATLFMGITGESFAQGHEGTVVAFGKVKGIQTNGGNYSQLWEDGTIIYAGTDAVKLTSVKPSAPNPIVEVLAVVSAHANDGTVFVRPNYFTADVFGPSSATDNAIARFDGTTGKLIQTGGITIADGATGTLAGSNSGDVTLAGTPNYLTIANQVITRNNVNLGSHVTGTLPVANGGTGQTALSSIDAADFGSGAAADNYVLTADGAGGAAWEVASGGGGSSITGTGIAYVRSGGNDTTGTIGNPSLPYLTAQAAWDDGARKIEFGSGTYAVTHISSESDAPLDVFFRGAGKEATTLNFTFTGLNGTAGVLQTDPGQTGNPGTSGGNAGAFTLSSDKSLSINLVAKGGTGGDGGKGGPGSADPEIISGNGGAGGNAGNGPTYEVFNCVLASLSKETDPGQGGQPGDDGGFGMGTQGASGTSGVAVTEHYYWCDINAFGNNVVSADMDACLRDDKLFVTVPSNRVEYGAGFVEDALNVLYGERVETRRIESTNWVTTSSTVADVNNLSCLIDQYEQLTIEIFGFHTSGTGGMKVSFSGPSSPTFLRYNFHHWTSVTAVRSPIPGAATAFNTDLTEGGGSTVVMPFHVLLVVKNGATQGTIQFRAASVTGGQTLTLLQETVMRVTR